MVLLPFNRQIILIKMPNLRISWKEYGNRLVKLRTHMEEEKFDAYLVTSGEIGRAHV